jgi:hypothetical protein
MSRARQCALLQRARDARNGASLALLVTHALDILLESLDLVPCFQAFAHDTKVEFLHENEVLVHVQENISCNFLLFKDVTVV